MRSHAQTSSANRAAAAPHLPRLQLCVWRVSVALAMGTHPFILCIPTDTQGPAQTPPALAESPECFCPDRTELPQQLPLQGWDFPKLTCPALCGNWEFRLNWVPLAPSEIPVLPGWCCWLTQWPMGHVQAVASSAVQSSSPGMWTPSHCVKTASPCQSKLMEAPADPPEPWGTHINTHINTQGCFYYFPSRRGEREDNVNLVLEFLPAVRMLDGGSDTHFPGKCSQGSVWSSSTAWRGHRGSAEDFVLL